MGQSACLVIYIITVNYYASIFNYTPVDRASDYDGTDLKSSSFNLVWAGSFLPAV